ncbi:hypothetical protein PPMP20_04545 [Paraburkholderia phymatum]
MKSGNTRSCGCGKRRRPQNRISLAGGEKFGMLAFVSDAPKRSGNPNRRVVARCDCGSIGEYFLSALRTGSTKSCGCLRDDHSIYETHGHTSARTFSPEYYTWTSMKTRCTNAKSRAWADYGGRGITVCERWIDSFENFLADMGPRPQGMTLDRFPDSNGNYEPGNCRWATPAQQSANTRRNTLVEFNGVKKAISEWATEYGLTYNTLIARIHRLKWPIEKALTTPPRPSYKR